MFEVEVESSRVKRLYRSAVALSVWAGHATDLTLFRLPVAKKKDD